MEEINELKGRFWLWESAISQSIFLLRLAKRANGGTTQDNILEELKSSNDALHAFRKTLPDYEEGKQSYSHILQFDRQYEHPFPKLTECYSMHDACVELAIVYFCQILNPGNGDPGSAARNDKNFIGEHLNKIASKVFTEEQQLSAFKDFCNQLKTARDKMLGHADAKSFEIQHGEPVSKMKMHRQAWQELDLEYWSNFLEPFRIAVLEYSKECGEALEETG